MSATSARTPHGRLIALPTEVRQLIYEEVFDNRKPNTTEHRTSMPYRVHAPGCDFYAPIFDMEPIGTSFANHYYHLNGGGGYAAARECTITCLRPSNVGILQTSKKIYKEALPILRQSYRQKTFAFESLLDINRFFTRPIATLLDRRYITSMSLSIVVGGSDPHENPFEASTRQLVSALRRLPMLKRLELPAKCILSRTCNSQLHGLARLATLEQLTATRTSRVGIEKPETESDDQEYNSDDEFYDLADIDARDIKPDLTYLDQTGHYVMYTLSTTYMLVPHVSWLKRDVQMARVRARVSAVFNDEAILERCQRAVRVRLERGYPVAAPGMTSVSFTKDYDGHKVKTTVWGVRDAEGRRMALRAQRKGYLLKKAIEDQRRHMRARM